MWEPLQRLQEAEKKIIKVDKKLVCKEALYLGDIIKSRHRRGDAKAGERKAPCTFTTRLRILAWLSSLARKEELTGKLTKIQHLQHFSTDLIYR